MENRNYKLIEDRQLSISELQKGMDFEAVLKMKITPGGFPMSKGIVIGLVTVATVIFILVFTMNKNGSNDNREGETILAIKNSVMPDQISEISTENLKSEASIYKKKSDTLGITQEKADLASEIAEEGVIEERNYPKVRSLEFKVRGNADAETAITIKDSIYGPANVSVGKGDYREYADPSNKKATEKNSAWFKFTIKRDTLLTFHIVPTLKTDDYDFALFKCENGNCLNDIKLNKLKPVRYCFSWNTTLNINTGLSNKAKDTTFQAWSHVDGDKYGKTYARALHVKNGETYYLMINISNTDTQNKEPEGFMIYFYNYLPKWKANTYQYPK